MRKRSIFTDEYLSHHGIQGQKWGVQNGPPYPLSERPSSPKDIKECLDEIHKDPGASSFKEHIDNTDQIRAFIMPAGNKGSNLYWDRIYVLDSIDRGWIKAANPDKDPGLEKDLKYCSDINEQIMDVFRSNLPEKEEDELIEKLINEKDEYILNTVLPRYAEFLYEESRKGFDVGELSPKAESYLKNIWLDRFLTDDFAKQAIWQSDDNVSDADSYTAVDDNDFDDYFMLRHHGINGQKWGVQNGPPYPLRSGQRSSAEETKTGIVSKSAKKLRSFTEFAGRSVKNGIKNRVESYKQKRAEKKEHDKMVKEQTKAAKKASAHVDFTNMTTQEIREATARLNAQNAYEQEYNKLHPQKPKSNVMKDIGTNTLKTLTKAGTDALAEAGKEVGKQFLSETLGEAVNRYLGYDVVDTKRVKEAGEVDGVAILNQLRSGFIKPENLTTKQLNAVDGILKKFDNVKESITGDSSINVAKLMTDIMDGKRDVSTLSTKEWNAVSNQYNNFSNMQKLSRGIYNGMPQQKQSNESKKGNESVKPQGNVDSNESSNRSVVQRSRTIANPFGSMKELRAHTTSGLKYRSAGTAGTTSNASQPSSGQTSGKKRRKKNKKRIQ